MQPADGSRATKYRKRTARNTGGRNDADTHELVVRGRAENRTGSGTGGEKGDGGVTMNQEEITKSELSELYLVYEMSIPSIANMLDISPYRVRAIMKTYNIPTRRTARTKKSLCPTKKILKDLYTKRQLTCWQIGDIYGVNGATVAGWLHIHKIKTRRADVLGGGKQIRMTVNQELADKLGLKKGIRA